MRLPPGISRQPLRRPRADGYSRSSPANSSPLANFTGATTPRVRSTESPTRRELSRRRTVSTQRPRVLFCGVLTTAYCMSAKNGAGRSLGGQSRAQLQQGAKRLAGRSRKIGEGCATPRRPDQTTGSGLGDASAFLLAMKSCAASAVDGWVSRSAATVDRIACLRPSRFGRGSGPIFSPVILVDKTWSLFTRLRMDQTNANRSRCAKCEPNTSLADAEATV